MQTFILSLILIFQTLFSQVKSEYFSKSQFFAFKEKVKAICDKIIGTFDQVNDAISDIEKRAQLSVPLLRSIEDALTVNRNYFYNR